MGWSRLTKCGIRVGSFWVDGVLDRLVVGLDGNLVLAGTALVLVVLDLASGDILGAHVCGVVLSVLVVEEIDMFDNMWFVVAVDGCERLWSTLGIQAVLMLFLCSPTVMALSLLEVGLSCLPVTRCVMHCDEPRVCHVVVNKQRQCNKSRSMHLDLWGRDLR
jgi:hypothetical protein